LATSYPFSDIAVIGIGLIGASIVHAAKFRNLPVTFTAYDNNPEVRAEAEDLLPHIKITTTLQQAVADAELVILAVPVGVMDQVIKDIAPYLRPGCVITDTGDGVGVYPDSPNNVKIASVSSVSTFTKYRRSLSLMDLMMLKAARSRFLRFSAAAASSFACSISSSGTATQRAAFLPERVLERSPESRTNPCFTSSPRRAV